MTSPTFDAVYPCFAPSWLGAKPHHAISTGEGWMVYTYLPSGDPAHVEDCDTEAEALSLAQSLSAPTLWEAPNG